MIPVDDQRIKKFVSDINDSYQGKSILSKFHNVLPFDPQSHQNADFFQIGRRHNLPMDCFPPRDNYSNLPMARQFADAIVMGEKEFIADRFIRELGSSSDSSTMKGGLDAGALIDGFHQVADPDYILMPLKKEYQQTLSDWLLEGRYWMGGLREISIQSSEAEIIWLPSDAEVQDIVIVDGEATEIIRKEGGEEKPPGSLSIIDKYSRFSQGKPVICTFAEYDASEDAGDEFDFWYRTVLSEPRIRPGSGFVIKALH